MRFFIKYRVAECPIEERVELVSIFFLTRRAIDFN